MSDAVPKAKMVSTGICTRCQQDLIQAGDVLGCPVCGEHVKVSQIHMDLRMRFAQFTSGMYPQRPTEAPRRAPFAGATITNATGIFAEGIFSDLYSFPPWAPATFAELFAEIYGEDLSHRSRGVKR